jgi:energy-coupling factor transporter ATP-binding protein EcfA2
MRLLRLHLPNGFRGLPPGFEVRFHAETTASPQSLDPLCLVGLNGSGKSNLLQVLAEIFRTLEAEREPVPQVAVVDPDTKELTLQEIPLLLPSVQPGTLAFTIEYVLDRLTWEMAQGPDGLTPYHFAEAKYPVVRVSHAASDQPGEPATWTVLYDGVAMDRERTPRHPPCPST